MAKKFERTCIVCGEKYQYCMYCDDYADLPRWMMMFHDSNCREIFNTVCSYDSKSISKAEAADRLRKCDFSKKANYTSAFTKTIDDILSNNVVETVDTVDKVEEDVVLEANSDEEQIKEIEPSEETTYKVNTESFNKKNNKNKNHKKYKEYKN